MSNATRRTVLAGAAGVGAAVALAACAKGSSGSGGSSGDSGSNGGGSGATPTSDAIAKVGDIPVGSGKIFSEQNVVVTQPTSGDFKAFNATCTHAGCQVADISGGMIICPCHGSQYSIKDGSVKTGPAIRPLGAETVTIQNGEIIVAA
jgi:Rieske Fe-S protein